MMPCVKTTCAPVYSHFRPGLVLTARQVHLVTKGIKAITENGIVTADGEHVELDVIICATGQYLVLLVDARTTNQTYYYPHRDRLRHLPPLPLPPHRALRPPPARQMDPAPHELPLRVRRRLPELVLRVRPELRDRDGLGGADHRGAGGVCGAGGGEAAEGAVEEC